MATRGLDMRSEGGIRIGANATRDATAPGANATFVLLIPVGDRPESSVRHVEDAVRERYDLRAVGMRIRV
jgi:hypothetical protein